MNNQPGQYLNKDELINSIPRVEISVNDLGSTDTYHEEKILKKYLSLEKNGQILLYKSSIQLAIIGYGKKNYGFIRLDDKTQVNLVDIFKKYNVKFLEPLNVRYEDDELSARRLLRLFRYQIQEFIIKNKRPSYLWNKYADKQNINYMSICFPGGEHLAETPEEAIFLINTYEKLDLAQNTKI